MRLLVTGGLGFIGSNFILSSIERYERILNVDNASYGSNPANLESVQGRKSYSFLKEDIAKLQAEALADVDAIVNFAAETHVDRSIASPGRFLATNVLGACNLLELARRKDVSVFLQISTDEVYGSAKEGRTFTEEDRISPSNPYSASKAAAEHLALAYHRTYGLKCLVSRCTNNFGPYQFPEKLIPKAVIRALRGLKVPLYGSGRQVRSWIYVSDHVDALNLLLREGRPGEVYNITAWNELPNEEVVHQILGLLGKKGDSVEHVEDRPGHDERYSIDAGKIERELGWKPKHEFRQALNETVQWYLRNSAWWQALADERTLASEPWKLKW